MNSFDFIQAKQRYQISASDIVRAKFDYIFKLKVLEFYFGLKL
jgi:outer membrane protein